MVRFPPRSAAPSLGLDPATIRRARGRGVNGCTRAFQALGTGSTPVARSQEPSPGRAPGGVESHDHGEWRSLVAHPAGGRAVAGSNPVSPIYEATLSGRAGSVSRCPEGPGATGKATRGPATGALGGSDA